MVTGSLLGVKLPEHCGDDPNLSSAEVTERVELYLVISWEWRSWVWHRERTYWFLLSVKWKRNVMAHAQKPDSVFQRNGRVHLYRRGCQFSRVLAFFECESSWRLLATHSIRLFPLHFSSRASPCATRFRFHSTLQESWRSGFLCVARMDPHHLLKNLQIPWFICRQLATTQLLQWVKAVRDRARLVYRSPCSALWDEISTLAYESNASCCPKRLSVAYCTHIIQTKLTLKNRRYPQKSMCLATGVPTGVPLVVLG